MDMVSIFNMLIFALVIGVALWVLSLVPGNDTVKKVVTGLILIGAGVWAIRWLMRFLQ